MWSLGFYEIIHSYKTCVEFSVSQNSLIWRCPGILVFVGRLDIRVVMVKRRCLGAFDLPYLWSIDAIVKTRLANSKKVCAEMRAGLCCTI